MKINEKNMCYFATSPPIDKEGWLLKRGEVNKSWQRRHFVLKGNLLFYFEKKGDREPLGAIILEGCTIELSSEGENYSFQIVFHGINNRTYYLAAETQEIMETWMKALTCASYEYMKMMVLELQRQLNEIGDSNDVQLRSAPKPPPRRQNPFNRPAPPPPVYAIVQKDSSTKTGEESAMNPKLNTPTNLGGGQNLPTSLSSNDSQQILSASNESSNDMKNVKSNEPFTFQLIHEAFGREIMQDLKERKRLKELAQQPLIQL